MTPGSYLLDTNIVIALFARDGAVFRHLKAAAQVFVPSIVIGELYYGARNSQRSTTNIARVQRFAASMRVLPCDSNTAEQYSMIKHALKTSGHPIPENDLWIAALAQQYQCTLVTRDHHFTAIASLTSESW